MRQASGASSGGHCPASHRASLSKVRVGPALPTQPPSWGLCLQGLGEGSGERRRRQPVSLRTNCDVTVQGGMPRLARPTLTAQGELLTAGGGMSRLLRSRAPLRPGPERVRAPRGAREEAARAVVRGSMEEPVREPVKRLMRASVRVRRNMPQVEPTGHLGRDPRAALTGSCGGEPDAGLCSPQGAESWRGHLWRREGGYGGGSAACRALLGWATHLAVCKGSQLPSEAFLLFFCLFV